MLSDFRNYTIWLNGAWFSQYEPLCKSWDSPSRNGFPVCVVLALCLSQTNYHKCRIATVSGQTANLKIPDFEISKFETYYVGKMKLVYLCFRCLEQDDCYSDCPLANHTIGNLHPKKFNNPIHVAFSKVKDTGLYHASIETTIAYKFCPLAYQCLEFEKPHKILGLNEQLISSITSSDLF